MEKKLYRSQTDRIFAGVCGGLGDYFDVEPLIFRAVFLVLILGGGSGLLLYILLAIIIPREPGPAQPINREEKIKDFASKVAGRTKEFVNEFKEEKFEGEKSAPSNVPTKLASSAESHFTRNFGLLLVFIGATLLLKEFLPQGWFRWDYFWPAFLIVVGFAIMLRRENR